MPLVLPPRLAHDAAQTWAAPIWAVLKADFPALCSTAVLAAISLSAVSARCGGAALPLDDAYIHLTYARAFAELHPWVYSEGALPSAGTTSFLWPLALAPFHALGFSGMRLASVASAFGFFCMWGVARETRLLAEHFISARLARFTGLLPLTFGASTWFAASGMEVMPFAWLLAHASRNCIDWLSAEGASDRNHAVRLLMLAGLCPLLRPEGVLIAASSFWVLLQRPYRGRVLFPAIAMSSAFLPSALTFLLTGAATTATAEAKWLPLNPYYANHTLELMWSNLMLLFGTLLDGRGWTPMFLPTGVAPIAGAALCAIAACAVRKPTRQASLILLWLASGVVIPTSYETFLVNRLRYIWPFMTPWFIGLGILAHAAALPWRKTAPRAAQHVALVLLVVMGLGLASKLPASIADLSDSAHAINEQQVSLAHWAARELPENALLGVNDAGALAYLSERRTFDLVGLTTRGEARHWVAGAGSRFEHYERMERSALPSHFIVYPEWFQLDPLLGARLTERTVDATILGGPRMQAHVADYSTLGSAQMPDMLPANWDIIDELDVADLDSEQLHGYQLYSSSPESNRIFIDAGRVDGGRSERTSEQFSLGLGERCALVLRMHHPTLTELSVLVDGALVSHVAIGGEPGWSERRVPIPTAWCNGTRSISLGADAPFASLHYWSISER